MAAWNSNTWACRAECSHGSEPCIRALDLDACRFPVPLRKNLALTSTDVATDWILQLKEPSSASQQNCFCARLVHSALDRAMLPFCGRRQSQGLSHNGASHPQQESSTCMAKCGLGHSQTAGACSITFELLVMGRYAHKPRLLTGQQVKSLPVEGMARPQAGSPQDLQARQLQHRPWLPMLLSGCSSCQSCRHQ